MSVSNCLTKKSAQKKEARFNRSFYLILSQAQTRRNNGNDDAFYVSLNSVCIWIFPFFCCRCEQKSACESARLFTLVKLLLTGVLITWHWISLGKWGNDKSVNKINNELLSKNKNRVYVLAIAVESVRFYLNGDVIISNVIKTKHLQSFYHASNWAMIYLMNS